MKNKVVIILLMFTCSFAMSQVKKESSKAGQKVNVPELVKKEFTKKFPTATKIEWSLEKAGEYEADFNMNKMEMSSLINEKGVILEIETEIKESELPSAIKNTLAKDFAKYKIDECEKVDSKGVVTYEMEIKKGKTECELVFDINGKLLKEEPMKEKENN